MGRGELTQFWPPSAHPREVSRDGLRPPPGSSASETHCAVRKRFPYHAVLAGTGSFEALNKSSVFIRLRILHLLLPLYKGGTLTQLFHAGNAGRRALKYLLVHFLGHRPHILRSQLHIARDNV